MNPSFTALIKLSEINPYVDVPMRVAADFPGRNERLVIQVEAVASRKRGKPLTDATRERLQAVGRLSPDGWFRVTLIRMRNEPPRIYLDMWMRAQAGLELGDRARITVKPDTAVRELAIPRQLGEALRDATLAQAWNALAPSRRNEILRYLNSLRTPDAVARNVAKVVARLTP